LDRTSESSLAPTPLAKSAYDAWLDDDPTEGRERMLAWLEERLDSAVEVLLLLLKMEVPEAFRGAAVVPPGNKLVEGMLKCKLSV